MSRSLDLPATEGVDALAQELAKLQDNGKRKIAFLGSRHVPVVDIHLIELIARSLAEEGHSILTSVEIIEQAFGHVRIHESIKASYAIQLVQEHVNLKRILEKIDFPCNFSDKC